MTTNFITTFLFCINIFFVFYLLVYSTFLFLSVATGTTVLYQNRYKRRLYNELTHDYYFPISIIVPTHNENMTVVDTVTSLLHSKYRLFEIIVVDDGSTDDTAQLLINHFQMHEIQRPIHKLVSCQPEEFVYQTFHGKVSLTLVRKKNGGKADSLNMGINISQYPYFVCMDADSVLQDDALENIMKIMKRRNEK